MCQLRKPIMCRCLVRKTDPLRELLECQTPLDRVVAQETDDYLAIDIRSP
ncbi:MAG: hypothetical protein ABI783_03750 [Actinomycetota bacterium]